MAWNEPGGKQRDPWSNSGNGQQPPDLDAMLKRLKDSFGGKGGGPIVLVILAVLALWFAFDSWRTVDATQRGVVLRFGEVNRVMQPGLNFKWPTPIERVEIVEATKVRSTSDQVRMLTKDENIVIIDFTVQYQASDPVAFLFGVRSPEEALRQAAESAVRQVIGANLMDTIFIGQRAELVAEARVQLQSILDIYGAGLIVTEFNFSNVRPPPEVKEAFDEAISAREQKETIRNEADAYSKKVLPEARGTATRILNEAEGDKASAVALAEGETKRFELMLEQYRLAPEVTRKRLLIETMQDVLAVNPKVMVSVKGRGDNIMYLPLDRMMQQNTGGSEAEQPRNSRTPANRLPAVESVRGQDTGRSVREGRN